MGDTTRETAITARRTAVQHRDTGSKAGGKPTLDRSNQARIDRASVAIKEKKLTLRVEMVSLMREIGRKPFSQIDQILNLSPGTSRETYEKHNEAYKAWTKKHASEALHRFYQDQITVLESLSHATPSAVALWANILNDPSKKPADRERAAKEIREWTKLFLATKESAGIREVIPKHLLEAHDKAEELGGHLQIVLGSALDVDQSEAEFDEQG